MASSDAQEGLNLESWQLRAVDSGGLDKRGHSYIAFFVQRFDLHVELDASVAHRDPPRRRNAIHTCKGVEKHRNTTHKKHTHNTHTNKHEMELKTCRFSCSHIQLQPAIAEILAIMLAFSLSRSSRESLPPEAGFASLNLHSSATKVSCTSLSTESATHWLKRASPNREPLSTKILRAALWAFHSEPARTTVAKDSAGMRRPTCGSRDEHQSIGQS